MSLVVYKVEKRHFCVAFPHFMHIFIVACLHCRMIYGDGLRSQQFCTTLSSSGLLELRLYFCFMLSGVKSQMQCAEKRKPPFIQGRCHRRFRSCCHFVRHMPKVTIERLKPDKKRRGRNSRKRSRRRIYIRQCKFSWVEICMKTEEKRHRSAAFQHY